VQEENRGGTSCPRSSEKDMKMEVTLVVEHNFKDTKKFTAI